MWTAGRLAAGHLLQVVVGLDRAAQSPVRLLLLVLHLDLREVQGDLIDRELRSPPLPLVW